MGKRAASPPICASCLRQHLRLPSPERARRRALLVTSVEWEDPPTRRYAEQLFDHLTLAAKVWEPGESQIHPYPELPEGWTGARLRTLDRHVVRVAFAIGGQDVPQPSDVGLHQTG